MLTRRTSIAVLLTLLPGAAVGLASGTAAAAPLCLPNACAHSNRTLPGEGGTSGESGGGGGGGGGGTGPGIGCPTVGGDLACTPGTAAPAAAPHIPTIDVAYDARDNLQLPVPGIGTAPSPRSYIRITTGLWVDDVGNKTAVADVPGQHVTVTADQPVVTWNMGDGNGLTCAAATAGTPGGTDCGYTYQRSSASRPDHKYTITATITYRITWACQGNDCDTAGGAFGPMTGPPGNLGLAVGEVQTQSQPG
ncbi:hypothetical protein GCM10023195_32400 [Actinoallomurus liliacearum]|uniref:Secreted protein n=1 Tax=Actinoallomurus liliacearum TaxID=1080073 RepID=A0ABP8TKE1_9ACTN